MLAPRFLAACAALAMAAPLSAQDYVWSDNRPDAAPPTGVIGDRTLPAGSVELRYVFSNTAFEGVQLGNQPVAPVSVLDFYESTPFQRRDRMHRAVLAFGASESFTLLVDAHWIDRTRGVAAGGPRSGQPPLSGHSRSRGSRPYRPGSRRVPA